MDSYEESGSSFSAENDDYIKKHINPVIRGQSAIFGDPLSQQKNDICLPSPEGSQQQEEEYQENRSKLNLDDKGESESQRNQEEKQQPKKQVSEEVAEMLQMIKQPLQQKVEEVKEEPKNAQFIEPIEKIQNIEGDKQQEKIYKNQLQQNQGVQLEVPLNLVNPQAQKIQIQERNNDFLSAQQAQQRLRLKRQRMNYVQMNNQQMVLILQGFKKNTQSIETAYNHIQKQNIILAQFKQDASRKLEENIKSTLKEKMNQINRENSKEIKDIKNLTENIQEILLKNEKRIDKMEKGIDEILNFLKIRK